MPVPTPAAIDPLGVAHMQRFEGPLQAVIAVGHQDQVNVIGHQTISQDLHCMRVAVGLQPIQVRPAILVGEEHILAAIAALRDVVRETGKDGARQSGHAVKANSATQKREASPFLSAANTAAAQYEIEGYRESS